MWPRIVAEARWAVWAGGGALLASLAAALLYALWCGLLLVVVRPDLTTVRFLVACAALEVAVWLALLAWEQKRWSLGRTLWVLSLAAAGLALLASMIEI